MSSKGIPDSVNPGRSLQFTTVLPLTQLAGLCWQGTAAARRATHASRGRTGCPTPKAPYGETDPWGALVNDACLVDDCLDLYHDVLVDAGNRLERRWATGPPPTDPVRYAASVVPTVLVDRQRAGRVAKGWPAKPTRADGKAGVVNAHLLASAPDGPSGQWYVALFRILRGYASSEGRLRAGWPVAGLTQEKGLYTAHGSAVVAATGVDEDIRHVLGVAQQAVGKAWVHQIIWHPLLSGVAVAEVPDDLLTPGGDLEDQVLTGWFRVEYLALRGRGLSVKESFRAAAGTVGGCRVPDPDPALLNLLEDLVVAATH